MIVQLEDNTLLADAHIFVFNFTLKSDTTFISEVSPEYTNIPLWVMIKFDERPRVRDYWKADDKIVKIDIHNNVMTEEIPAISTGHAKLSYQVLLDAGSGNFSILGHNSDMTDSHVVYVAMIPENFMQLSTSHTSMDVSIQTLSGRCVSWNVASQAWSQNDCEVSLLLGNIAFIRIDS